MRLILILESKGRGESMMFGVEVDSVEGKGRLISLNANFRPSR